MCCHTHTIAWQRTWPKDLLAGDAAYRTKRVHNTEHQLWKTRVTVLGERGRRLQAPTAQRQWASQQLQAQWLQLPNNQQRRSSHILFSPSCIQPQRQATRRPVHMHHNHRRVRMRHLTFLPAAGCGNLMQQTLRQPPHPRVRPTTTTTANLDSGNPPALPRRRANTNVRYE